MVEISYLDELKGKHSQDLENHFHSLSQHRKNSFEMREGSLAVQDVPLSLFWLG